MGKPLLESIYYLSYLRPIRPVRDCDLVQKTAKGFSIQSTFSVNTMIREIDIQYTNKKKEIIIDTKKVIKHSEILGKFLSVLFSADDLFIINGSPSIKRRFFNMFFSVIDPLYLQYLRNYERLIKHKNKLLKDRNIELLPIFDQQIAEAVLYIQQIRQEKIHEINLEFSSSFSKIGFYKEQVSLHYQPSIKTKDLQIEHIIKHFHETRKTDLYKGYATTGPHKDDFLFQINNVLFSRYGSFGQLRLAALIIKYVQAIFYKKNFNTNPVYLLDDVILELDNERKKQFIEFLNIDNQLFITLTDKEYVKLFKNNKIRLIEIENGKIL